MSFRLLLRHFRWEMYGEQTDRREDVSVSLCSVILIFWVSLLIWLRSNWFLLPQRLLGKLDFHNFTIRINDRKILKAMAQYSGFPQESFDTVFIILDKMDKIGLEGVAEELEKEGFAKESIDTYLGLCSKRSLLTLRVFVTAKKIKRCSGSERLQRTLKQSFLQ